MKSTKVFRNIQFGVKNLLLQKLQSSLTILGIVFGIARVVAMLSIGEGASKQADKWTAMRACTGPTQGTGGHKAKQCCVRTCIWAR